MNRRAFLQSVIAVPLAARELPRVPRLEDVNLTINFDRRRAPQLNLSPEALSESAVAWAHEIDEAALRHALERVRG